MSDEPGPLAEIAKARAEVDRIGDELRRARAAFFAAIHAAFDAGKGPSAVGRAAGFTREHAANIRDWKVKDDPTPH